MTDKSGQYSNLEILTKAAIKDLEKHESQIDGLKESFTKMDKAFDSIMNRNEEVVEWKNKISDIITTDQLKIMHSDVANNKSEIAKLKTVFSIIHVLVMIFVSLMGTGLIDIRCVDNDPYLYYYHEHSEVGR